MTENVENLILTQLREIRGELRSLSEKVDRIEDRTDATDQKVNGISVTMVPFAGRLQGLEALEGTRSDA